MTKKIIIVRYVIFVLLVIYAKLYLMYQSMIFTWQNYILQKGENIIKDAERMAISFCMSVKQIKYKQQSFLSEAT